MLTCTLTGLPLKADFTSALGKAVESDESVTLALLDVDGFMNINQKYGHEEGDRLLTMISQVLTEAQGRLGLQSGRVGGDEFGLIMTGVSLERGFLIAEELRQSLASHVPPELGAESGVTFSIGVANYPRDAKDAKTLMQKADQALYQAKEGGRNQVALPATEEMILRSSYYSTSQLGRLKKLAEQVHKKESVLLREALDDLLRKYDQRNTPGM